MRLQRRNPQRIRRWMVARSRIWKNLSKEDRHLLALGIIALDVSLSVRGPQKLSVAMNRDKATAAKTLKMGGDGAQIMTLLGSLLTAVKGAIDSLLGKVSSKNSLVWTMPETTLRVRGMSNQWSLAAFAFKSENAGTRDAFIVEQTIALVFGNTGKPVASRERIFAKALMVQRQIDKMPFTYGIGEPSLQSWTNLVSIETSMWMKRATTRQFMQVTDALLSDSTPHSTWLDMVENIRAVCVKINTLSLEYDVAPPPPAADET
eukprot:4125592-Amphidinium_carterae.1